jgi:hypothetical protein
MSLLKNLTSDSSIADEKDSIGSSRAAIDSGIYTGTIEMAYLNKAASGALGLVLDLKTSDGKEIRQTFWMTGGTAKGCNNFFMDKDGNKQYLPGFIMANSVALLAVGKEISEVEDEEKIINVYSSTARAEVPTKTPVLVELIGKEITFALIKQIEDKTKKNEITQVYESTGETREVNEIEKFFRASDKMTTAEIRGQATEAAFYKTWADKWTGKIKDKSGKAPKGNGTTGVSGTPGAVMKKQSLFG